MNNDDYGTVTFKGENYILTQQAYIDNYGTDGEVKYYAHAEDEEGRTFKVVWETTSIWDLAGELYNLELKEKYQSQNFTEEDAERMEELSEDYSSDYIEDESNACDWDKPVDVYEV